MTLVYRVETNRRLRPLRGVAEYLGCSPPPRLRDLRRSKPTPCPEDDGLGYTEDGEKVRIFYGRAVHGLVWIRVRHSHPLNRADFFSTSMTYPRRISLSGADKWSISTRILHSLWFSLSLIDTYYSNIHFSVDIIEHDE